MDLLLRCYAVEGPNARVVRAIPGHHPVQPALAAALEAELRKTDWAATKKERPTVRAAGYVTFQHPRCHSRSGTGRLTKAARTNLAKLRHFDALWKLIVKVLASDLLFPFAIQCCMSVCCWCNLLMDCLSVEDN
eukprot:SAG31_NODE_113_length_24342_cov_5.194530_5_plen_134_part_00